MSDEDDDDQTNPPAGEDKPGWAAPHLPPTQPRPGLDPPWSATAPGPPPPAAPAPVPPPPAPGQPGAGWSLPPAPPTLPRRRRRWPWALGGVLGVIALLAVAGVALFVSKVKPPIDATNAFLRDLDRGDFDAAYDRMCANDREFFTTESLGSAFGFIDDYEVNPFDVSVDGDRAKVSFDSDVTDGDREYFELSLRKDGGRWRPCLTDAADLGDLDVDSEFP
jgi:hypothetical protein